ncbi:unnamed protein product, partial [Prorocentrum cordatum]
EPRWCCRRCCSSRARTSTTHRSRPQAQASRHSPAARRRRARRPPRGPPSRRARCRARRRRYAWRIFFHIPKCAGSTFEKHFFRSAIGANISILKPCVHTGKPTVYSTIGYDHYPAGFDPDSEPLQCGLNERESCKKGRRAEVIRISIACAGMIIGHFRPAMVNNILCAQRSMRSQGQAPRDESLGRRCASPALPLASPAQSGLVTGVGADHVQACAERLFDVGQSSSTGAFRAEGVILRWHVEAQRPRLEEGVKRSFPVGRRGG